MNGKYSKAYLLTHDIDFFFRVNVGGQCFPCHMASNGGLIPEKLNKLKQNREIAKVVSSILSSISEKSIDIERISASRRHELIVGHYRESLGGDEIDFLEEELPDESLRITRSFDMMAKIGFWSYDRVNSAFRDDYWCCLMAKPRVNVSQDILSLLPEIELTDINAEMAAITLEEGSSSTVAYKSILWKRLPKDDNVREYAEEIYNTRRANELPAMLVVAYFRNNPKEYRNESHSVKGRQGYWDPVMAQAQYKVRQIVKCDYPVGYCAEQHAGNDILKDKQLAPLRPSLSDFHFSEAVRPRTGTIHDYCKYCKGIFPSI